MLNRVTGLWYQYPDPVLNYIHVYRLDAIEDINRFGSGFKTQTEVKVFCSIYSDWETLTWLAEEIEDDTLADINFYIGVLEL